MFKYTKATMKEEGAVVKLHSLLYKDDDTKTTDEIVDDVHTALKNKILWVAKNGDEIIGFVLCKLFDAKQKYFPNSVFIDGLYVTNEHRKQGIAKNLLNMVLKEKYPEQYTYFSITHDPTSMYLTKFYQSLGFLEKGVTEAGNMMMVRSINK